MTLVNLEYVNIRYGGEIGDGYLKVVVKLFATESQLNIIINIHLGDYQLEETTWNNIINNHILPILTYRNILNTQIKAYHKVNMPVKENVEKFNEVTEIRDGTIEIPSEDDTSTDLYEVTTDVNGENTNTDGFEDMTAKCVTKFKELKKNKNMFGLDDCIISKGNETTMLNNDVKEESLKIDDGRNKSQFKVIKNHFDNPCTTFHSKVTINNKIKADIERYKAVHDLHSYGIMNRNEVMSKESLFNKERLDLCDENVKAEQKMMVVPYQVINQEKVKEVIKVCKNKKTEFIPKYTRLKRCNAVNNLHKHDKLNQNEAELKMKVDYNVNVDDSDEDAKIRCEVLKKRLEFTYTDRRASGDSTQQLNNKLNNFTRYQNLHGLIDYIMIKRNEIMKNHDDFSGRSLNVNSICNTAENVCSRKKIVVRPNHHDSENSRSPISSDKKMACKPKDARQRNSAYKSVQNNVQNKKFEKQKSQKMKSASKKDTLSTENRIKKQEIRNWFKKKAKKLKSVFVHCVPVRKK